MDKVGLIGGADLEAMVEIVEPGQRPIEDYICIGIDKERLPGAGMPGPTLNSPVVEEALKVVKKDYKEKSEKADGFVSIRVHVATTAWRLREDHDRIHLGMDKNEWGSIFSAEEIGDCLELPAHGFVLCRSLEKLWLPKNVAAFLQTRTTVALLGLDITPTHQIVPGFGDDSIFLEMHNLTDRTLVIPRFAALAELFFTWTSGSYPGDATQYREATESL